MVTNETIKNARFEVDRFERCDLSCAMGAIDDREYGEFFDSELEFSDWFVKNIRGIATCFGITGFRHLAIGKTLFGSNLRPDIYCVDQDGVARIFELKHANRKFPQSAVTNQVAGIGQALLYKAICEEATGARCETYLVDNVLFSQTVLIIQRNQIALHLAEVNPIRIVQIPAPETQLH